MLGVVVSGFFSPFVEVLGLWLWLGLGEDGRVGDDADGVGVVMAWDNTGYTIGGRGISVGECNTEVVAYSLEC